MSSISQGGFNLIKQLQLICGDATNFYATSTAKGYVRAMTESLTVVDLSQYFSSVSSIISSTVSAYAYVDSSGDNTIVISDYDIIISDDLSLSFLNNYTGVVYTPYAYNSGTSYSVASGHFTLDILIAGYSV